VDDISSSSCINSIEERSATKYPRSCARMPGRGMRAHAMACGPVSGCRSNRLALDALVGSLAACLVPSLWDEEDGWRDHRAVRPPPGPSGRSYLREREQLTAGVGERNSRGSQRTPRPGSVLSDPMCEHGRNRTPVHRVILDWAQMPKIEGCVNHFTHRILH
jgi:hypothetical protein